MVQPFQVSALALPVTDRIVHELELAQAAEVRNRKNRIEDALQTGVFPLAGQEVHLQKSLVGLLLHLDQVRDRDRGFDFREINSFAGGTVSRILHFHSSGSNGDKRPRDGQHPTATPKRVAPRGRESIAGSRLSARNRGTVAAAFRGETARDINCLTAWKDSEDSSATE
jgi:hypothetical protein